MNYPYWELDWAGGGLLIAIIATFHVFISHFAVGGGLWLVLSEMRARKSGDTAMLGYVKTHTRFFLLVTMVAGALSGVGIWLVISVYNPQATSFLIHTFVLAWATEWTCFLVEIVSLFLYYYTFDRMAPGKHIFIGWVYFISAWLSLFFINGIIGFMFTPGAWPETGNFWDALFNPSFWPSLAFRTFLALSLAGIYGLLTSSWLKDGELRQRTTRWNALWLAAPVVLVLLTGWRYLAVLPELHQGFIAGGSPEIPPFLNTFLYLTPVLFIIGVALFIKMPQRAQQGVAALLMVLGFMYVGSFEYVREAGRRPYIIQGYMYSNGVEVASFRQVRQRGVLKNAKWSKIKEITEENQLAAGRELYNLTCMPCHSINGPLNDITLRTGKYQTPFAMAAFISGMGKLNKYMPPFPGTTAEREALATYLVQDLGQKNSGSKKNSKLNNHNSAGYPEPAGFDPAEDDYLLTVAASQGMHFMPAAPGKLALLTPPTRLRAQLLKRGETPELFTEGADITYRLEHPRKYQRLPGFWAALKAKLGGLAPLEGKLSFDEDTSMYVSGPLPIEPFDAKGEAAPYPVILVEARTKDNGRLLASTKLVVGSSAQMGCAQCHGGGSAWPGGGFSQEAALEMLATHDRMSRTSLVEQAQKGMVFCQDCHPDPALNSKGDEELLNMAASIHGLHAVYLADKDQDACLACHPADAEGMPRSLRGVHSHLQMACTDCHGFLEDHAASLLKKEQQAGKPGAQRLLDLIKPRKVESLKQVIPRTPWINEPDCLTCHEEYQAPEITDGFNRWTEGPEELYQNRKGEVGGVACISCHSATHALYPGLTSRDSLQPWQYQENPYTLGADGNCQVCHVAEMVDEAHHPNSLRPVRNEIEQDK